MTESSTPIPDAGELKRNEVLSFDDGLLTIKISGHGAGDGWGSIAFHDRQIEIDADGFHVAEIPPSELRALRDFLNRVVSLSAPSAAAAQVEDDAIEALKHTVEYFDFYEFKDEHLIFSEYAERKTTRLSIGHLRNILRAALSAPPPEQVKDELRMLRERIGPRGLEVVEIDGRNHYVNEAVKAEIIKLRAEGGYDHGYADGVEWAVTQSTQPAPPPEQVAWECAARRQTLPEPTDCDWPVCGCDPHAGKVIAALEESGRLSQAVPPEQGEAVAYLRELHWRNDKTELVLAHGDETGAFPVYRAAPKPPAVTREEIERTVEELRSKHRNLTVSVSGTARAMAQQSMIVCDDLERRFLLLLSGGRSELES